jgi:hypothetical protein
MFLSLQAAVVVAELILAQEVVLAACVYLRLKRLQLLKQ